MAIRKLMTLQGTTLSSAFTYLYVAIQENETGAFSVPFPFRWAHKLPGENDRMGYANFMNLVIQYTKLDNPASIHERVDVPRTLSFIKNIDQRGRIIGLFASK